VAAFIPSGPVRADDPVYQEALAAEAAFWASPETLPIADALAAAPLGPFKRHHNRRLTGSETRNWYEQIAEHGPYRRGLVLGSGSTIEETAMLAQNPGVHLTFCDIDAAGLSKRQAMFDERFPGRVTVEQMDLNLIEFESDAFDLIVSASTLHHVVNLEHIAAQINRALSPDGWFFLHDFTGASGFRFPIEQKRIFEVLYARERKRRPNAALPDPDWRDVDNHAYSPFEAVRSADIVRALADALDEVDRRETGTILTLALFCDILRGYTAPKPRQGKLDRWRGRPLEAPRLGWETLLSSECLRELCLLDDVITDAGLFPPLSTVGVYRKKA